MKSGHCVCMYRVFIKYCVFPWNVVIFLNSASSTAAIVFDLPLTLTPRGNRERPESGIYFKIFEKTQYLTNILYIYYTPFFAIHHTLYNWNLIVFVLKNKCITCTRVSNTFLEALYYILQERYSWLAGWSVGQSWYPKRARSYTSILMLLSECLVIFSLLLRCLREYI